MIRFCGLLATSPAANRPRRRDPNTSPDHSIGRSDGRINQVAFLGDAAPRPRAAGAVGGRERTSCTTSELLLGPGRVGSTRTGLWGTMPPRATDADRLQTVRWTGTEPAGRDDQTPLTRPRVPAFPTPPWHPHPARPLGSEQMEAREAPVQHR
ncbi:hypothetical protein K1719_047196 [Acacia pycnantha]|nr:hypothetical protein K1719_047196 [Acacia pycnantha]